MILQTLKHDEVPYEYVLIDYDEDYFATLEKVWHQNLQVFVDRFIDDINSAHYGETKHHAYLYLYHADYLTILQALDDKTPRDLKCSKISNYNSWEGTVSSAPDLTLLKNYKSNFQTFVINFITKYIHTSLLQQYFLNSKHKVILYPSQYQDFIKKIQKNPF